MTASKANGPDVHKHDTVYLTENREGWTVSVETAQGGEIGRYPERAAAVLVARAETVVRRAWLLVQPRRSPVQFLSTEEIPTAVIAGELPPNDTVRFRLP